MKTKSLHDIPMSIKLKNILMRYGVEDLSQMSSYSREEILGFRNLGEKLFWEMEQICREYGIEIRSVQTVKESFAQYHFSARIYPMLFKYHIYRLEDFRRLTSAQLFEICCEDNRLTMRTYEILTKNGVSFDGQKDKHNGEVLYMPMSMRLKNALIRKKVRYLSQISSYSKEDILRFQNFGKKKFTELEQICREHGIEIYSIQDIKGSFEQYHFPVKIYPMLFRNHIFYLDDFKHLTANRLFEICCEDYRLTMQAYYILTKNGIVFEPWQDKYIFEILSERKAALIWKTYWISKLSQMPCSEQQLKQSLSASALVTEAIEEIFAVRN
nr:DNA-directed RNA polymerase subunit alpha C-terminal domain-containing protein [uncultured Schaedlerella sp.]